ncbi:MAG: hypothetical protein ACFCVD_11390 [Nodosilinea sp.]
MNEAYCQGLTYRGEEHRHLVQFMVHQPGVVASGDFFYQDATQSSISGSGIQPTVISVHPANQPEVGEIFALLPQRMQMAEQLLQVPCRTVATKVGGGQPSPVCGGF